MNAKMKKHLEAVVEAVIFEDTDTAKVEFHNYLNLKTQAILLGEKDEDEGEKDEDEDNGDADEDNGDADEDNGDKDNKKPPFFAKKSKKSNDEGDE